MSTFQVYIVENLLRGRKRKVTISSKTTLKKKIEAAESADV
jgi:hypothetical protein